MHQDLNEQLANFALTCVGRAERSDQAAAERTALAEWNGMANIPGGDRQAKAEAEQNRADARRWRDRATMAKEGFLLIDREDHSFQREFNGLLVEAIKQSRVRYTVSSTPGNLAARTGEVEAK